LFTADVIYNSDVDDATVFYLTLDA